jgi:hypothetical protein
MPNGELHLLGDPYRASRAASVPRTPSTFSYTRAIRRHMHGVVVRR